MRRVQELYFDWLVEQVVDNRFIKENRELLDILYHFDFISEMEMDDNLICNSLQLRDDFIDRSAMARRYSYDLDFPCTVLEIMVYLSITIEDTIMTNSYFGDRTGTWFEGMIVSLGLEKYLNGRCDEQEVIDILEKFIERQYERDGKGGLFTVKIRKLDMRSIDIWSQAMAYLTEFVKKDGEIY